MVERKVFLNLGCGTTHLPSAPPPGHEMVDPTLYEQPFWVNVDKVKGVGADITFDLFAYPWPLKSHGYDGALLAHIIEHIPHEPRLSDQATGSDMERWDYLSNLQDGWFAFFSELWRVLKPGAVAHIVCPHAHSDGAYADPTHTRYIMPHTFTHSLETPDGSTFRYETGCSFKLIEPIVYRPTPMAAPYLDDPAAWQHALMTRLNMVYDMYARLQAVK